MNNLPEHNVLPADLLRDIARLRGHLAPQQSAPVAASILYPVSAAIAAEERRKEEDVLRNARFGQEIPGHGIFIGMWQPEGLRQKFNIFAAKEDLTNEAGEKETYIYLDAVERIAALKDWHGHHGMNYATDKELYEALNNGDYDGGWFIPPHELLAGINIYGVNVQPDNLHDYKDKGALARSFCAIGANRAGCSDRYWSSTEDSTDQNKVHWVSFSDICWASSTKDRGWQACRPVRLEVAP